jgi:hypothetical protein
MKRKRLVQRVSERVCPDAVVSAIENTKQRYSEIFNELILPVANKYMAEGMPFATAVKFAKKELTLFAHTH